MTKYEKLEDLREEQYNSKMKELGVEKMMTCDHKFRVYTKYKRRGEFIKVRRVYRCVKCGIRTVVSWSEHT